MTGDLGAELFSEEAIQDPYPLYARMHAAGPVHRIGNSDFHAVCSWDAVTEAVGRHEDFSSNLTGTMLYQPDGTIGVFGMDELGGPTQVLAIADDPVHAAHRKLLVPHLAAKHIRELESFVTATVARLWDTALDVDRVEWMSAMANRLPMMVVCRLIGVPDSDVDRLTAWGYASTQLLEGLVGPADLAAAGAAVGELAAYIAGLLDRPAPEGTLLADLASACAAGDVDAVTAQVMMVTLFSAGGESTASLIGSATHIIATRPDLQRRLRDDPALITPFIEEVLRVEPPFRGHYRHVLRDCELHGYQLRSGARLVLLWGAANRDPAHVESPDEFRIDRRDSKSHVAFGRGAHFCVGAALARLETRLVLEYLLSHTDGVRAVGRARWLPSLLVRRLEALTLAVQNGGGS
ncbi:MAG: cytochrome P450 [Mycobacterium kyogaense]|uniref:cytochrome P450 n=1 Tax=Mycobacterium kyogaense TaxID=2212479 RepID=UPI002FF9D6FE